MNASESAVVGSEPDIIGNKDLRYTLVEFGDYQCPPCRAAFFHVTSLTKRYEHVMRFQFRNLPLVHIHRYALNAAIVAEEARQSGVFWSVHDHLYETPLDTNALARIAQENGLPSPFGSSILRKAAETAVRNDVQDARLLGVDSTPTFILCCPGHKAYRLSDLDQLSQFIQS